MLGRLGRYEIESVIGSGGMGVVLRGFDTELHRPVAIKVLSPHLAGSGPAQARLAAKPRRSRRLHTRRAADSQRGIQRQAALSGHAVYRRQLAASPTRPPRTTRDQGCRSHRDADSTGSVRRARSRHCASRRQAGEHSVGGRRRPREDYRLRLGPCRRRCERDTDRDSRGNPSVHVSRTDSRRTDRRAATCSAWAVSCTPCAPGRPPFRAETTMGVLAASVTTHRDRCGR